MAAQNWLALPEPRPRDAHMEALAMVLRREIPWRQHCHRADDIATAIRLADEFGYDLVIDHGTEAHVLGDVLAARGTPVLIGPLFTTKSKPELRGPLPGQPGQAGRGRRRNFHHHRPPRGAHQLPGPPGHLGRAGGPGPG